MTLPLRHLASVAAVGLVCVLAPAHRAWAQGDLKLRCAASYEQSQRLRKGGKLRQARDETVACAQEACPAVVRKQCAQWLPEVEASVPTLVVSARDASGAEVLEARVFVDAEPVKERLDGKAIEVDPGRHVVRVEAAGRAPGEATVFVSEGEKGRATLVRVGALRRDESLSTALAPADDSGGIPVAAWVAAGVGVVGVGLFATFAIVGRSEKADAEAPGGCAPRCTDDQVGSIRTKLVAGDVALGVGVVALGVATWLVVTAPPRRPAATGLSVDFAPAPGGGWAAVRGELP